MAVSIHQLQSHKFLVKSILIILFFILSPSLPTIPTQTEYLNRRALRDAGHSSLPQTPSAPNTPCQCRTVRDLPRAERCAHARQYCGGDSRSMFNYAALHYCYLNESWGISVSILVAVVILEFYVLATTAERHFSRVVGRMASLLRLSPSMGGVTLLALGNGAPDVFASIAAVRGDNPRIGLGAILSAGTFVSALVVGFVALTAAPFSLKPFPFVRDVFFYMVAATTLFYVYLSGVIFLWQAVGLVLFYVLFVAVVFWMDQVAGKGVAEEAPDSGDVVRFQEVSDRRANFGSNGLVDGPSARKHLGAMGKYSDKPLPQAVSYAEETTMAEAGELLGCLAALGVILKLPPTLLGLTVLAWGNSVGDLVADVAVAKAGRPAMAMAGCFAGPMFNMLIGLGIALVMRTARAYPSGYYLHFHVSIVVAFVFLFMSLLGSLLVITWSRFQVPRFWGFCLIALYIIFVLVSLMVANIM